mmetsp:Transcript_150244/g.418614  ORF Transcript_150244/g.418614 Transcript_150244/m.418614 type:complete len:217 (+) Transcript_150244:1082-1732(+)
MRVGRRCPGRRAVHTLGCRGQRELLPEHPRQERRRRVAASPCSEGQGPWQSQVHDLPQQEAGSCTGAGGPPAGRGERTPRPRDRRLPRASGQLDGSAAPAGLERVACRGGRTLAPGRGWAARGRDRPHAGAGALARTRAGGATRCALEPGRAGGARRRQGQRLQGASGPGGSLHQGGAGQGRGRAGAGACGARERLRLRRRGLCAGTPGGRGQDRG